MSVFSTATVVAVGLTCKAFLNSGFCSIQVEGFHNLRNALQSCKRDAGQGIITICNHISTLDDPVAWGVLPARYYLNSRTTRWSLGASDIMFTNPFFSKFFSLGQTIETFRGKGIYQDSVDTAIAKLNEGEWIHLFGEGKVNQSDAYLLDNQGRVRLPRFKWGIARMLMEVNIPPVVIPMWLTGFDKLMPEGRVSPFKYFPRVGARLSVTFGQPMLPETILKKATRHLHDSATNVSRGSEIKIGPSQHVENTYDPIIRQEITTLIHQEVQDLGRSVSSQ